MIDIEPYGQVYKTQIPFNIKVAIAEAIASSIIYCDSKTITDENGNARITGSGRWCVDSGLKEACLIAVVADYYMAAEKIIIITKNENDGFDCSINLTGDLCDKYSDATGELLQTCMKTRRDFDSFLRILDGKIEAELSIKNQMAQTVVNENLQNTVEQIKLVFETMSLQTTPENMQEAQKQLAEQMKEYEKYSANKIEDFSGQVKRANIETIKIFGFNPKFQNELLQILDNLKYQPTIRIDENHDVYFVYLGGVGQSLEFGISSKTSKITVLLLKNDTVFERKEIDFDTRNINAIVDVFYSPKKANIDGLIEAIGNI